VAQATGYHDASVLKHTAGRTSSAGLCLESGLKSLPGARCARRASTCVDAEAGLHFLQVSLMMRSRTTIPRATSHLTRFCQPTSTPAADLYPLRGQNEQYRGPCPNIGNHVEERSGYQATLRFKSLTLGRPRPFATGKKGGMLHNAVRGWGIDAESVLNLGSPEKRSKKSDFSVLSH
jgi:hypothetical protein